MKRLIRPSAASSRTRRPAIAFSTSKPRLETLENRWLPSTVTNLLDGGVGSLRDAIAVTPSGGTVDFQPGLSGVISLSSVLSVNKNLTIDGPGAPVIAVSGGGVSQVFYVAGGKTVEINGLTIREGTAAHGGGIQNFGTLTLVDCLVTQNSTFDLAGGGAGIFNAATMTISGTTISHNTTFGNGGGIFNTGTLNLVDDTIAGNSGVTGGGIANAGSLSSLNTTIAANQSGVNGFGGGIYVSGSPSVSLKNTIVALNNAGNGPDIHGGVTIATFNLIGVGNGSSGVSHGVDGNLVGTNSTPISPSLGTLQNNGGPTSTMALLDGSPAKDAGTKNGAPALDQRGFNRVVNVSTDMGAYEHQMPATQTILVSTPNPSTVNQPVAITATVVGMAEGSNTPTGTVTFYDGASVLGTRALNNGSATFVTTSLLAGSHTFTASYAGVSEGDHGFAPSTSDPLSHTVTKSTSVSAVASSPNPSMAHQKVTFTAFVTPSAAGPIQPTGSVKFFDNGTPMGMAALSPQGQAVYQTSVLTAGTHMITAEYLGDPNFLASVSVPREQVVELLVPHVTIASSLNPAKVEQAVTLTATAYYPPDSTVPAPTGTVTILDGSVVLAILPLSGDAASFSTSTLKPGSHTLTARYESDGYYATFASMPLTQVVRRYTMFAVGGAPGHVLVYRPNNTLIADFTPYGADFKDLINVAVGDITGDGYYDLVTGAGRGNPHVKVYDGKTLWKGMFNPGNADASLHASFFPYALQFNVGSNVAVGDIDGDGYGELVTGANIGNPHVKVHDGEDIALGTFDPTASILAQWFPYALQFNVGASVAVGDVTGDGHAEVVTGANVGNPHVKVYDGNKLLAGAYDPDGTSLLADWFAYGLNFNVGAHVAVADVVGKGFASIVTGASVGNPHVRVYDGEAFAVHTFKETDPSASEIDQFFAYDLNFNVGVTVGAADFDEDGQAEILTGASVGAPHYRAVKDGGGIIKPPAMFEGLPAVLQGGISVGA